MPTASAKPPTKPLRAAKNTSTRPTRIGHLIGQWVHERGVEQAKFDIELLDLAKFHLPLYDEPKHPSLTAPGKRVESSCEA